MTDIITVSEGLFANGRAAARAYTERRGIEGPVRAHVETLIASYDAVRKASGSHYAALYVAAHETMRGLPDRMPPAKGNYSLPGSTAEIFERVAMQPAAIAGYCRFLVGHLGPLLEDLQLPSGVLANGRTYTFFQPARTTALVGLESEETLFRKYAAQLFLYDPRTRTNPDRSPPHARLPPVVLLSGPPGTGKSSLIEGFCAEGKRLSRLVKVPFTVQYFESTQYSRWLGGSQRNVKRQFDRVRDPSGVGALVLEDVDLLLAENDQESSAIRHVKHYVMNALSGRHSDCPNTLTIMTTNEPGELGRALYSRTVKRLEVNPFVHLAVHERFWHGAFPSLRPEMRGQLAQESHAGGLTGRDLEAVVIGALDGTTRAPTDEELLHRSTDHERRYGQVSLTLLQELLAARSATAGRTAARRS